ncbi:hypothetical protein Tco_0795311 [Tanacetum coccineum]
MLQQLLKLSFEGLQVAFGLRDVLTYSIFIIRSFTEESLIEKTKLESDSPREYDDEFLKAFKEQFHGKKNWTCQDAVDREKFEMSKGRIGLVEVIEE